MIKVKNWLNKNNYTFKEITLTDGNAGIMVNTDYIGPHPTKDTYEQHRHIEKYITRHTSYKAQQRGHYTGLLIH